MFGDERPFWLTLLEDGQRSTRTVVKVRRERNGPIKLSLIVPGPPMSVILARTQFGGWRNAVQQSRLANALLVCMYV